MKRAMMKALIAGVVMCRALGGVNAAEVQTGQHEYAVSDLGLNLSGIDKYLLYVPESYKDNPDKEWPLMIFLHGTGGRGTDISKLLTKVVPRMIKKGSTQFDDFIVLSPQGLPNKWWNVSQLKKLINAVADIEGDGYKSKRKYHIDKNRLILTGLSMGGITTINMLIDSPNKFAAAAPICGRTISTGKLGRIKHVPMWFFHGDKDTTVKYAQGYENFTSICDLANVTLASESVSSENPSYTLDYGVNPEVGNDLKFTTYHGVKHNSWDAAYARKDLVQWMLKHSLAGNIEPEAPVVEEPVVEAPVVEAPVVEAPVVEAPIVEAPVVEAPVVEKPVVEEPIVEAPVVEVPVVEDPVVEEPVVEESSVIELQSVSINHKWTQFAFSQAYKNPVVVFGALSYNGKDPAFVQVRNVTSQGFEARVREWDYLEQWHTKETVSYIVLEAGVHTVGGLTIEAKVAAAGTTPVRVDFSKPFDRWPVILTTVGSDNGKSAVIPRIVDRDHSGYEVKLQQEEAAGTNHTDEIIYSIAIEKGLSDDGTIKAFITDYTFDENVQVLTFDEQINNPIFFTEMQTIKGRDPASIRWMKESLTNESVELIVQEELSADDEISHAAEKVGCFVIAAE